MAAENDESLDDLLAFMEEDAASSAAPEASPEEEFEESAVPAAPTLAEAPKAPKKPRAAKAETPAAPTEDAAQRRIRELQAELDRPILAPTNDDGRPLPEHELTEEQKQIRDLEDKLARRKAEELVTAQERFERGEADTITIHFLEDGFTAQGRVWYRGQELEFVKGGQAYEQTKDRNGKSWLDLADDEFAQAQAYGKVIFRRGFWPGQRLDENEISAEERRRNRAAPIT